MKKIVALLVCLVCFFGGFAIAEVKFNADDYSDDELIDIMKAIYDADTQLGYLYSNDVLLVGKDIPAGPYEFWVEESDIGFSNDMIERDLDYHCGWTTLCMIFVGTEKGEYDDYRYIFYDQYNMRIKINLSEGQYLWTEQDSGGANYLGLRMKYFPNRRSGLFSD